MGTVVTSSCWGCENECIQGEGTLGLACYYVTAQATRLSPALCLFFAWCIFCSPSGALPHQAVPDLGRPQQAHRGNDKACGFTAMVGTLDLLVFFISVVLG